MSVGCKPIQLAAQEKGGPAPGYRFRSPASQQNTKPVHQNHGEKKVAMLLWIHVLEEHVRRGLISVSATHPTAQNWSELAQGIRNQEPSSAKWIQMMPSDLVA